MSKEKTDRLQALFAIFKHYEMVMQMADKEISTYIVGEIFPDVGLVAEDYPFCSVDIGNGVISLDEDIKKEANSKNKETKK